LDPALYWALIEHLPGANGATTAAIQRWLAEHQTDDPESEYELNSDVARFLEPGEKVQHITAEEMAALEWK
jgi:hypothetical protein